MVSDPNATGSTSPLPVSESRPRVRPKHRISHTKSRNGCLTCKTRRVKCDEERPICGACSVREDDCIFPPPQETRDYTRRHRTPRRDTTSRDGTASGGHSELPPAQVSIHPLDFNVPRATIPPQAPGVGSTNDLNMFDLTLLQHYILHASKKMTLDPRKSLVWERVIPDVASKHPFLMHLLLALAGLDLLTIHHSEMRKSAADRSNTSDNADFSAVNLETLVQHHQKGLQGLQEKLATAQRMDGDVLFAGSMLVVGFAFASNHVRDLQSLNQRAQQQMIPIDPSSGGTSAHTDRPQVQWLRLVRGVTSIVQHSWTTIKLGRLRPLLFFGNANDDWKLQAPEKISGTLEKTHPEILSQFAQGAPHAASRLRGFLNILRNESSASTPGESLKSPIQSPNLETFGTDQRDEVFVAQDEAIAVVENMYMRVVYVLHLQQVELSPASSHRDAQAEMEDAAISSWPHLVPEAFITSLESDDNLNICAGFSYAVLAHLYLLLVLLDEIWYFGENFGIEIRRINALIAGLGRYDLSELMSWPISIAGLRK